MVDDKQVRYYRFTDAIKPIILITPKEKELIAYLEENKHLLEGDGIVIAEMAEELGFKNGTALGQVIRRQKKTLSEDTDHFIHKIVFGRRLVDDKLVNYYRFTDAITLQEKELIAYFEENMELLDGDGILNTKIVEELGFKNGQALGWAISKLKKKLFEGHFIHRIVPEIRWIDGKQINFYLFTDAITLQEKERIAYFEENKHLLEGDGILNTKIVEKLGFKNGEALGLVIRSLKKTLSEDTAHIIHKIVSEQRRVDDKLVRYYRFADAITSREKKLIAYLEENKHLLEGDGIANTEIVDELGFENGQVLGQAIRSLKKTLSEDTAHIIHKIVSEQRRVDDKRVNYYRFTDAIILQEKELIAYLEENKHLLEGDGIVNTKMVEKLGFKNGQVLGRIIGRLKKTLSENTDHFIHKIVFGQRLVDDKLVNYYRFTDAIILQEKELIAYFEENKHLLEGDGILNTKIVDELEFKNGEALGQVIRSLKKTLSEDTAHIIHKIVSELRMVDNKKVSYYRFTDAIILQEKELIAYLEENKHLLEGDGIVNTKMVEKLGFKNGTALGQVIGRLKKTLSEDTDHFIHRIVSEQRMVDDKQVSYYLFADAIKPIILITPKEKELIAYLEENMQLLEEEGIVIAEMAEKLGFKNGTALGQVIRRLKRNLSEDTDHIIHKIVSYKRKRLVDDKKVTFYRIKP